MKPKQERHGTRRRLHSRGLVASLVLASASLSACGDDHGSDSADLRAILDDGDITQTMNSMLTAPPPGTGIAGTSGSTSGSGGTTGTAGRGSAGSVVRRHGHPGHGHRGPVRHRRHRLAGHGQRGHDRHGRDHGQPGPDPNLPGEAQAFWRFDDCNMDRTELFDSSFNASHTAYRSVPAFCRPGILNTGIGFDEDDDLVLVPDQPNFVFSEGFTVAAWVKPVDLGGVRTIFRKREAGTSTFALVENGQNFQIVISLANGKAADVQAKATLDKFTHVAATFDGIFLKLYLDGQEAASKRVVGRLSDGVGPLLMGNDANKRRIDGLLDSVLFDTLPSSAADIAKLTCLPQPSVMNVTPVNPAAVPPGTPVSYDVTITNNSCEDANAFFNAFPFNFNPDISVSPNFDNAFVPAAGTVHFPFTAIASEDIDQFGTSQIGVNGQVSSQFTFESFSQIVNFSVFDNSTPCTVKPRRELEIRDVSVVDDWVRTGPGGAWTFGTLMENMAPMLADAPRWSTRCSRRSSPSRRSTSFGLPPRFGVQNVLDSMRRADGTLDLSRAPFRLLDDQRRLQRLAERREAEHEATLAGRGRRDVVRR